VSEFLTWIEASWLGRAMRDSGLWTYAIVNLAHVLGVATLFGSILVLDLRLLGIGRRLPVAPLAAAAIPVAGAGIAIAAVSGVMLLSSNATEYQGNPWLLLKFPAIAVGLINVVLVRRTSTWRALGARELTPGERGRLAVIGGVSLVAWLTAVTAGRMIAYW
jgi:hypothetical protein